MRRPMLSLMLCLVTLWARAGGAADASSTQRFIRCTFTPVPKQYRAVSTFDALAVARDGCVYMGTSTYGSPAQLLRYDPSNGSVVAVCDVSTPCRENADKGLVQTGKIHTPLRLASDGKIYFGSHLGDHRCMTGENPHRYGGGHFMCYDPATGRAEDLGVAHWPESVMRVELDETHNLLYGMTYPDGHFIIKNLKTGEITDKGKAAHSGYAMPLVLKDGRAYWTSRQGHIGRYDPDKDTIEEASEIPVLPSGKPSAVWSQFTGMQRPTTDRAEIWGVLQEDAGKKKGDPPPARFLFRFRCPAWTHGRCSFEYVAPIPQNAGGSVVIAPDGEIYMYVWNLDPRLSYFDRKTKRTYDLGVPRDDQGRVARIAWTGTFAADGTLYIGGVMDIPEERFTGSGYGYGTLGFYRILPADLAAAVKEARQ